MRLPAAARLGSERQAGGYRCAAEEGGPGHRTQWADPCDEDTATLAACPIPTPSLRAPHNRSSHLPAPPISPPPLSADISPPIFPVVAALPNTGPWLPCVAHATSLSTRLVLMSWSEEWEGTTRASASGVGGVVGRSVPG